MYQVYRPDGVSGSALRELSISEFKINENNLLSKGIGVYAGTYLIRVQPLKVFTGNQYSFCAEFTEAANWEDEYNDTPAHYSELALNTVVYGTTSKKSVDPDSDWYMFTIPESGTAIISFDHAKQISSRGSWLVEVTDLSGRTYSSFTSKPSDTRVNTGDLGLKPGRYMLSIEPVLQTDVEYSLYIFYLASESYEQEFNDSPETATPLSEGVQTYAGLSSRFLELDKDYFSITLPENGFLQLNFTRHVYEFGSGGWNIQIFNEGMTALYHQIAAYEDAAVSVGNLGLPAGKYYVCIDAEGLSQSTNEYGISYTFTAAADGETELNNTIQTADTLPLNTEIKGALIYGRTDYESEYDYYSFTLTDTQYVNAVFTHDAVDPGNTEAIIKEGWIIALCDGQGTDLTSVISRWNTTSAQTATMNLSAGTYYVRVKSGVNGSDFPYKLAVRTVTKS